MNSKNKNLFVNLPILKYYNYLYVTRILNMFVCNNNAAKMTYWIFLFKKYTYSKLENKVIFSSIYKNGILPSCINTIVWLNHFELNEMLVENYTKMQHAILNKSKKQHTPYKTAVMSLLTSYFTNNLSKPSKTCQKSKDKHMSKCSLTDPDTFISSVQTQDAV